MLGHVAIVLHAHLPYVRDPEHEASLEERWLHEALWESYLPLVAMLRRLRRDGVRFAITLSLSPPLLSMLRDDLLKRRFEEHLARIDRLAEKHAPSAPVLEFYRARLREVRATWDDIEGDLPKAFAAERERGGVELITTSATHAYLPGLLAAPASIRAQLRLGVRAFDRMVGGARVGFWLPECAYDPSFDRDLAKAGVGWTILDAHGVELASPAPPLGIHAPVLSKNGVAFFARDPDSSRDVWSRQSGYPGDPWYREFYRDLGFDLDEHELLDQLGPRGTRVMTGLKLHRITGQGEAKEPYNPARAMEKAKEHAAHFVAARAERLREASRFAPSPIVVAPFDAELFGHWWFEGPDFLEHVLRGLDEASKHGGARATTPTEYLEDHPETVLAEPARSTWGEGGFGEVWAGPESARLWRHVHHAERIVIAAAERHRNAAGLAGRAVDQAVRELLLLEASDWAFMLRRGEMVEFAEKRVAMHAARAKRLVEIAARPDSSLEDVAFVHAATDETRFLADLSGPDLRDGFDAWSNSSDAAS